LKSESLTPWPFGELKSGTNQTAVPRERARRKKSGLAVSSPFAAPPASEVVVRQNPIYHNILDKIVLCCKINVDNSGKE
jgi:hypothetical protein